MQKRYPGSISNYKPGGRRYREPWWPWKLVLHTTETVGLPGYLSRTMSGVYIPPHITIRRPSQGTPVVWQHRDHDISASSLVAPGFVETNHASALQIEILGYAKDSRNWPTQDYEFLGEVVAWYAKEFDLRLTYPTPHGGESYGTGGAGRMSGSQWLNYDGICGHQDVPGNSHWDPGKIDSSKLLDIVGKEMNPMAVSSWAKPSWDKAKAKGLVTDATGPQDIVSMERLMVMLDRAGVFNAPATGVPAHSHGVPKHTHRTGNPV